MKYNLNYIYLAMLALIFFIVIIAATPQNGFKAPASADEIKNPLKGNVAATLEGKKTYEQSCVVCHGTTGKGDGIAVTGLSKVPADHSSAAVQAQTDGALYWKIQTGNPPMPSYKQTLTDVQIWQLVNYIRTLSAPVKTK